VPLEVRLELLQMRRLEQHRRESAVATGQNRLRALRRGRFETDVDAEWAECALTSLMRRSLVSTAAMGSHWKAVWALGTCGDI